MTNDSNSNAKRNMTGLLFVAFGALLLMNNFDMLPYLVEDLFLSWPMILIGIGLVSLAGKNYSTAIIFFLLGGFFILPKFIDIPISFNQLFWPVVIIMIGFAILAQRWKSNHNEVDTTTILSEQIDEFNMFGGGKRIFQNQIFKGGKITNIFGGSEIDFKGVELAEGTHYLDLTCIFGGSKLFIPSDWVIKNDVISILGGFNDKSNGSKSGNSSKMLVITGKVVFGGAEIIRV